MADNKPINWAYPFKTAETSANPLQYLTHMAKANDGFYPTGENGLWHGGVHFDNDTAAVFDQSSVRCIADGEVIAYRVNETYPISEYTESIPQIKRVPYSSGFVLVKHMLRPPQPTNGAAAASEQSPPTLTFYSLYMHLQDWADYQAKADLPRPGFWEAASYIVNTKDQGLNVRAAPSTNGTVLGMLSKGAQITVGSPEGDFCKLLSIVSGAAEPALTPDSEGKLPGFVAFKLLKAQHEPKAKDSVVVLPPGIAIKAGDLIGHLGTYQNHNGAAQPLLHLEVFSCEDVPGFISKSQAWARSLPDTEKSLLKVHKDASRLIAHRDDIKPDNPPKQGDAGSQIGVDLIIPQALLDALPAASKINVSTAVAGSRTPHVTQWWRLDGLFADKEGNPINGWLAEQDLITTRHSPWEWADFHCIEDTGKPLEKLAYTFNAKGMLSDDEKQNYRAQISKADGGPILAIARLYDIVDTNQDGVLTHKEIRAALSKPWHAQVLGQLITKYESEWFWNKSKWDELDPLLEEEPGKPNQTWEVEKQRIEELSWWKELAGQHGISGDGKAWHFQAIGLIKVNISPANELISFESMKKVFPSSLEAVREEVRTLFNKYAGLFEVNTPERMSQFFAQVKAEVGDALVGKEEDLWYSTTALRSLFGRYFNTYPLEADALGYKRISMQEYNALPASARSGYRIIKNYAYSQLPQEDEIAKRIYCCSVPGQNFHLTPGGCAEGLSYKGKGFIQLTWKENYNEVESLLKAKIPNENIDIVANPNQVLETKYGLLTALGFWEWQSLNTKSGNSTTHTDEITKIVNFHTKSYDKRKENFEFIYGILKNAR